MASYSTLYESYLRQFRDLGYDEDETSRQADLEARFDQAWGTEEEIFAPSPTEFEGHDMDDYFCMTLSYDWSNKERSQSEQRRWAGKLMKLVDRLKRKEEIKSLRRFVGVMAHNIAESDEYCRNYHLTRWHSSKEVIAKMTDESLEVPRELLAYAQNALVEVKQHRIRTHLRTK